MIKIIQQGDLEKLKKTIEFTCRECGCVFEADKDDYKSQFDQRENESWYEIKCPCCDKWVTKSNKEDKKEMTSKDVTAMKHEIVEWMAKALEKTIESFEKPNSNILETEEYMWKYLDNLEETIDE